MAATQLPPLKPEHEPMLSLNLGMHETMLSLDLSMHETVLSLSTLLLDPNHFD